MIKKLKDLYNIERALYIIAFLFSYPVALVFVNAIPYKVPADKVLIMYLVIIVVLIIIDPFKNVIARLLLIVQMLWSFSIISKLPTQYKLALESVINGCTEWARIIYENCFGEEYYMLINWIREQFANTSKSVNELYNNIFVIFVLVAILIIYLSLIRNRINWKIFLCGTIIFIVGWFIYVKGVKGSFSIYFVALTVYRQYLLYEEHVTEAKKMGERTRYLNYSSSILITTFITIIILFIANIGMYFLPIDNINAGFKRIVPNVPGVRSEYVSAAGIKIFKFSNTMYSPNDVLGGSIVDRNYDVIMTVKSEKGSLYLRGRVKNFYDGAKWTNEFTRMVNNINIDSENIIEKKHLSEIEIKPILIVSKTIFSPYKFKNSSFSLDIVYGNINNVVYRKQRINSGMEKYYVRYVKPEYLYLFDKFTDKELKPFLQLPKGLEKTIELTNSIVSEISSPYDKMKAIERYLRKNYQYTLMVKDVDTKIDFVEQFLFEEKKGYCTYFATSLAVMGRIADIPTRYVVGYLSNSTENKNGEYNVTANKAHAWVEAYIEGMGWVTFEPTPAYVNGDRAEKEKETKKNENNNILDEDLSEIRDNQKDLYFEDEGVAEIVKSKSYMYIFYIIILLALLIIIYSKIRRIKKDLSFDNYTVGIRKRMFYILSMLSFVDENYNVSELPSELFLRIPSEYLDIELDKNIIDIFNRCLYSEDVLNEYEFNDINSLFIEIEKSVKKKITAPVYFIKKIILNTLYHKNY